MEPKVENYLNDILTSARLLNEFTAGKTFSDYVADPLLRAATERQFEIIGEAISRLAKIDEATASRITEYQLIISFRNILIHQYDFVDNVVVWNILKTKLPILSREVDALLEEE